MNQEKMGKYIAECRKQQKLTQEQLAEKIGVTNKSISRWENGKTMPDVSLFEPLCKELNISINDLLSGEKTDTNDDKLSTEKLVDYSKYIKRKERRKVIILSSIMILMLVVFLLILILAFNKTFFRTTYDLDFIENASVPIPRFSYYRGTGGMREYTTKLKTLKQPDEVNILIDRYLNTLEKIECDNKTYYYNNQNDFSIRFYRINNDGIGFINTIYISYSDGNICS